MATIRQSRAPSYAGGAVTWIIHFNLGRSFGVNGKVDFPCEASHIINYIAFEDLRSVEIRNHCANQSLVDVAELGMPVTEISDLFLADSVEAVVALPGISLLVLPLAVCNTETSQEQDTDLTRQVDSVADVVFWCIFEGVGPAGLLVVR